MYNLNWHRSFDLCKLVDARRRARCECFLSLTLVWMDASVDTRRRARSERALTLTLTFDLSTQNHITRRISQGHSLYQVWILWDHLFLSYAPDISVKMHLLTPWPWHLTFKSQNGTTYRVSQCHSPYQIWTLWNLSFLSYAADKQTDTQTNRRTRKSYPCRPT